MLGPSVRQLLLLKVNVEDLRGMGSAEEILATSASCMVSGIGRPPDVGHYVGPSNFSWQFQFHRLIRVSVTAQCVPGTYPSTPTLFFGRRSESLVATEI